MKYRIILKGAVVLTMVSVLLFSNLSVAINTEEDSLIRNNQPNDKLIETSSREERSFKIQCYENFTCPTFPPQDYCGYGNWNIDSRSNFPWNKSDKNPKTLPYCAHISNGLNTPKMEEWLISPSLNFSEIDTRIYLEFSFKGDFHTARGLNNVDYNVMVSIDDEENWEQVWNENHILTDKYTKKWMDVKIELTKYSDNPNVLIGFQFITTDNQYAQNQKWNLDEIYVYNQSDIPLSCDTGGPYYWDLYRQYDHYPWGVLFHGEIEQPYTPIECKWRWDFDDGEPIEYTGTSHARHHYKNEGTYNITLLVTHLTLGISTKINTTLIIFITDDWCNVTIAEFSLGINAQIENRESYNSTNISWSIEVVYPPMLWFFSRLAGDGTIENLEPNIPQNIQGTNFFIKFGSCRIVITILPENYGIVSRSYNAFKIGPFYFVDPNPI